MRLLIEFVINDYVHIVDTQSVYLKLVPTGGFHPPSILLGFSRVARISRPKSSRIGWAAIIACENRI
jgi:hypothetical protein